MRWCSRSFNWAWGIVVYSVEKSKVFMLLQNCKDCDRRLSSRSFEFLRIHIWLTPLVEYISSQYFCSPSLTVERIVVNTLERCLVEHFEDPAMYRSLYGVLCNLGIQYNEGKFSSFSLMLIPKERRTDLWFCKISSLVNDVKDYVGLPVVLTIPSSVVRHCK